MRKAAVALILPRDGSLDVRDRCPAVRLVLIATELATNALVHGLPPTIVTLSRAEDEWLLDVADDDPGSEPVYAGARTTGAGGLGLHLAGRAT